MTFPVLASGTSGYNIQKSLRFRSSASAYLNRTPSVTSNQQKFTLSTWVKRGKLGVSQNIFAAGNSASTFFDVQITSADVLRFDFNGVSATLTNAVYRDPSSWYHIVVAVDTTQATSTNRVLMYVNGSLITSYSSYNVAAQNTNTAVNTASSPMYLSCYDGNAGFWDGYQAEVNFIDGQALTPTSFGAFNATTGVWQPLKYTGTYGTNGFYLPFSNNTSTTTLGADRSGNGNNWTCNNISLTAGTTYDSMLDVPTLTSATAGNYAVGNPLSVNVTTSSGATLADGNLYLNNSSANYSGFPSTMSIPITGKWAWKFKVTGSVTGSNDGYIGFACNSSGAPVTGASSGAAANWYTTVQVQAISARGIVHKYSGGSVVTDVAGSGLSGATGDEYEFLIDRDAGTTIIKLNGTTLTTVTGLPATQELFPYVTVYQTGGYFTFNYTPSDTSYKTLNTYNL